MTETEKKSSRCLNSTEELKQMILDNPELPLLMLAGDCANSGDYPYMVCMSVTSYVGEVLDCCQTVNDTRIYTDRDDFKEDLANSLAAGCYPAFDGTDDEWEKLVEKKLCEYDSFWKPCIIVRVDN